MNIRFAPNTLYYGDCLDIMRDFSDNCVDLICLDPPLNSYVQYHSIFKGSELSARPEFKAFDSMWSWDAASAARVRKIKNDIANPALKVITAFETMIPRSQMLSYTSYMAQRLFEMHRVLKDTGSIYLHCDPTVSHYLKLVMDAVFGPKNFRNEIVWHYSSLSATKKYFPKKHDVILFYSKSERWTFNHNDVRIPYAESIKNRIQYKGSGLTQNAGSSWINEKGKIPDSVWEIPLPKGNERLGFPTQKPLPLYERMIKASSNPGDIVLDPFVGSGTTIEAARRNNRKAIGIDILPLALRLINRHRLTPQGMGVMPVQGVPVDMETATQLVESDPYKFQDWTISLIDGLVPNPKRSDDDGVDGFGMLHDKPDNMDRKAIIVQVTGARGSQRAKFERLGTTIRNTAVAMGIFITLDTQTSQRDWIHDLEPVIIGKTRYEPIQCFSIEEYYKNGEKYEPPLRLPPLVNPLTGKPMQKTLFDR